MFRSHTPSLRQQEAMRDGLYISLTHEAVSDYGCRHGLGDNDDWRSDAANDWEYWRDVAQERDAEAKLCP